MLVKSASAQITNALRSHHWEEIPQVVTEYVRWLSADPECREPAELTEFCETWKVRRAQLYQLEEHVEFITLLQPYRLGTGGISRLAVRLATEELVRQSTKPGASLEAIKLLLRQSGNLTPEVKVFGSFSADRSKPVTELTLEELVLELEAAGGNEKEIAEASQT